MSLNGYNIKVTDAAYYDNVCEFVIKCRISGSDTGATYPEVTAVILMMTLQIISSQQAISMMIIQERSQ